MKELIVTLALLSCFLLGGTAFGQETLAEVDVREEPIVEMNVYPDPGQGYFRMNWKVPAEEYPMLSIYRVDGSLIMQKRLPASGIAPISLNAYGRGIYIVTLSTTVKVMQRKVMF